MRIDGTILRDLRKESGFTLDSVGVNPAHLSLIECGCKVPKLETLDRIVGAYGYSLKIIAYRPDKVGGEITYRLY